MCKLQSTKLGDSKGFVLNLLDSLETSDIDQGAFPTLLQLPQNSIKCCWEFWGAQFMQAIANSLGHKPLLPFGMPFRLAVFSPKIPSWASEELLTSQLLC